MPLTRRAVFLGPLASSLAGLAGSGSSRPAAVAVPTLRFVPEFDLRSFDPIANTAYTTLQHAFMIYDTLFAMDESFTPQAADGGNVRGQPRPAHL